MSLGGGASSDVDDAVKAATQAQMAKRLTTKTVAQILSFTYK